MRMHVVCWNERTSNGEFKERPKDYDYEDFHGRTHIYDVGKDELATKIIPDFDNVVITEWGDMLEEEIEIFPHLLHPIFEV